MKNRKTPWFLFILITAAVTIFSCQKEARDDSGNIPAGQSRLEVMLTDDPSPNALLSRLRRAVHERRLPFRVIVHEGLSSLSATGEDTIFVAKGRAVDHATAERITCHEVEGHATPRARARRLRLSLFRFGTARGADEQEGLALVYEERRGHLTPRRRRELAARHVCVRWMNDGATAVDAARALFERYGLSSDECAAIALRVYRGAGLSSPGLGRERVYLPSFLRVRALCAAATGNEAVLASGQVAADAIAVLARHAGEDANVVTTS